jgi:mono/diheme cytochrome c family protein
VSSGLLRAAWAVGISLSLVACVSGNDRSSRHGEPVPDAAIGREIYRTSCAACHGENANGNGPVSEFLSVPVPDLTRIAARRQGAFPELEIFRIIDGQSALPAHGPRHMPVWGYEFFGTDADDETAHRQATEKVDHVVAWLRSIQQAP